MLIGIFTIVPMFIIYAYIIFKLYAKYNFTKIRKIIYVIFAIIVVLIILNITLFRFYEIKTYLLCLIIETELIAHYIYANNYSSNNKDVKKN